MMSTDILPPRPRGRSGGRPHKISDPAIVATICRMRDEGATVPALCQVFGISRSTLYRMLV
jgi:Helix-turn-helix domain of resolvase